MEAQQPKWVEQEEPGTSFGEQANTAGLEKNADNSVEIDETRIVARGIRRTAESLPLGDDFESSTADVRHLTEKELERRHEIQDDAAKEKHAVSVGSVLAHMPAVISEDTAAEPTTGGIVTDGFTAAVQEDILDAPKTIKGSMTPGQQVTYAQSIRIGFFLALCLIAIFVLFKLVT